MPSLKDEGVTVIDKFNVGNLNISKLKMEMFFGFDGPLGHFLDKSKEVLPSNVDAKV